MTGRNRRVPAARVALLAFAILVPPAVLSRAAAADPATPDSTGIGAAAAPADSVPDFQPITDRWNDIKPPPYEMNVEGHWYDPYNQNHLKGDYPVFGQNMFLAFTASAANTAEMSKAPTPSGVSAEEPDSEPFFGKGERMLLESRLRVTLELYHGDTSFRPRDWEIRFTPVLSLNRFDGKENNNVNINPLKGPDRNDSHLGFQELFLEKHLANTSARYDFVSARVGIQRFASDFRHFIFNDFNLGARLFGNAGSNRWQYNVAGFRLLEKDTNSELNTRFENRHQSVAVVNFYRQDTWAPGYTASLSFHYNKDEASEHIDENGVPVRPAIAGDVKPHEIRAAYVGWAGDGHFGKWNVTHALYQAFGKDDFNSFAGREITINARMAALELSVDRDWMRFRVSAFYASGDKDPSDDKGEGFDAILDEPFFAGGPLSYWSREGIRLQGVTLTTRGSLLPALRSNKFEGQSNFVNPGILLANFGYDADLTPKIRLTLNASYERFADTKVLDVFLNQPDIGKPIGLDFGVGLNWRPFLNNNAIVKIGGTALSPMDGFNDIYESPGTQYATFGELSLTY